MKGAVNVYRAAVRASRTYYRVRKECPGLIRTILLDLLRVEGMSEVEIAFGAGISVERVREVLYSRKYQLAEQDFMAILDFFSRLFYRHHKRRLR